MSAEIVREQLIQIISRLDEEPLKALLHVAELIASPKPPPDIYEEGLDVAVDLFAGPTDIASRVEEIIEEEVRKRGSWTIKDPE